MSVAIGPDSGETWWTDVDHGAASRVKGFSTARITYDEPRQAAGRLQACRMARRPEGSRTPIRVSLCQDASHKTAMVRFGVTALDAESIAARARSTSAGFWSFAP